MHFRNSSGRNGLGMPPKSKNEIEIEKKLISIFTEQYGYSPKQYGKGFDIWRNTLDNPNSIAFNSSKYSRSEIFGIIQNDFGGKVTGVYIMTLSDVFAKIDELNKKRYVDTVIGSCFDKAGTLTSCPFSYIEEYKIMIN